jgi:hypothetical protein
VSKPSVQDLAKAHRLRAQGTVAIVISEEGDVTDAKVLNASHDASELLLAQARGMKFAPRTGCGVFKTAVNFTLQ